MEKTYNKQNTFKSINELTFENFFNQSNDIIIEDPKQVLHIEFYNGRRIYITDLTNAQKRGETCTRHIFTLSDSLNTLEFFKHLHALDFEALSDANMIKEYYNRSLKASEVFINREYYKLTNWNKNKLPKKWNKAALIKAYYNGLITGVYRNYRYTDDYARDAADKFGKGDFDIDIFIRDMMMYGSYNVWYNKEDSKHIIINAVFARCESFEVAILK